MIINKKAAMEMSVGTIVTIVLLMTVLILGITLVSDIFDSGSNAISQIDNAVQTEIGNLFAKEGGTLAVYPSSRQIDLRKGDKSAGFAFAVKNNDVNAKEFEYEVHPDTNFDFNKCGSSFSPAQADSWIIVNAGSFSLGPGNSLEMPELILFEIPESAPPCTIPYRIEVTSSGESYTGASVFVTIK